MAQAAGGADAVERMHAGGLALWLAGLVDGEPIGEFAAVVGQHGVHREGEGGERVCQECRPGGALAVGADVEDDEAGGAVDGDIGVGAFTIEGGELFAVEMDEAGRGGGIEALGRGLAAWASRPHRGGPSSGAARSGRGRA